MAQESLSRSQDVSVMARKRGGGKECGEERAGAGWANLGQIMKDLLNHVKETELYPEGCEEPSGGFTPKRTSLFWKPHQL